MPIRDRMEPETEFALQNNVGFDYELLTEVGLPVDEARNRLTKRALASGAEQIVFADADAFWQPGCLQRMLSWTTDPRKVIGAICGARVHFAPANARPTEDPVLVTFADIRKVDGLIPCHFIGAHVLAGSRAALERLGPSPWALTSADRSEDNAFARRIREAGSGLYLDTRAWSFHVENGIMYVPGSSAYVLRDGKVEMHPLPPMADATLGPLPTPHGAGAATRSNRPRPEESSFWLGRERSLKRTRTLRSGTGCPAKTNSVTRSRTSLELPNERIRPEPLEKQAGVRDWDASTRRHTGARRRYELQQSWKPDLTKRRRRR
jgi:hypothetical protein